MPFLWLSIYLLFFSRMLTLLSGSSIYRLLVTLEINGVPVTVDLHLRVSGGLNWSPYLTPAHHDVLGHHFSTVDRVVYEKFLFSILEVMISWFCWLI